MTNLSEICVISFYGKSNEWPTWNENFLAKAKRYDFKDILLGRSITPKTYEVFDIESEEGKKKIIVADLNELTANFIN
jgi:hypothetical protein